MEFVRGKRSIVSWFCRVLVPVGKYMDGTPNCDHRVFKYRSWQWAFRCLCRFLFFRRVECEICHQKGWILGPIPKVSYVKYDPLGLRDEESWS